MVGVRSDLRWLVAAVILLAPPTHSAAAEKGVTLVHVHGLSFSPDGKRLFIPSHVGLAIYSEGKWSKAPGPEHDFMGFSATRGALYSSGHPASGSSLRNPFGLLRSKDGGKTWEPLGLTGEADFHIMAVSYASSAVYVLNSVPNSRMRAAGIHFTTDEGKTWQANKSSGLLGKVAALAVHPSKGNVLAAATDAGVFLSVNSGDTFSAAAAGAQALSVCFDLDGVYLWYGGYQGKATLSRMDLRTRKLDPFSIPPMTRDAVAYITQNPVKRREYAIATLARNVYISGDGGKSWKQIAEKGETR